MKEVMKGNRLRCTDFSLRRFWQEATNEIYICTLQWELRETSALPNSVASF